MLFLFLGALLIVSIVLFVGVDWVKLYRFEFDVKKYLQCEGLIEKDKEYITYMKNVYIPREKMKKKSAAISGAVSKLREDIFNGMEREESCVRVDISHYGYFSRYDDHLTEADKIKILQMVTEELDLKLEKVEDSYNYNSYYKYRVLLK